ncbi:UPF0721 transmembrane protein [Kaistia sp. 32K]|uniref:sulfite exporter TauE/SafE family protein n=1 Tax=Kaistia sp. 32K TaxID=2795690 RepID=UPI001916AE2B|nr:sulfite exporter TauE/SafE family protein [Kaistia sp. 32K]BCP55095.1 UPF0721 transmembrane protein [Kaistia sp. 32K]
MFTDIAFYAAALPAVALAGLSKGGFGGAMGMLAVPVLALVISPIQAAGIMLPILLVMDGISLFFYRRMFDRRTLHVMLPASILGIAVGWMTAAYVKEDFVRLLVGLISILFALNYWFGDRLRAEPRPSSGPKGAFWGGIAGFTSFVSHAGAPPFQMYALPLRLDKQVFVGTSVIFFAVTNAVKLVPYFFLGQFDTANLTTAAVLFPFAALMTVAGIWIVRVIDQTLFYGLSYVFVAVIGLKLTWDGAMSLLVH